MSTELLEPPVRGMSLEDAILEFKRIQDRYAELAEEKKRVLEVLEPAAKESKGETKTVRLSNHNRSIVLKAEFGANITCDTDMLNGVKEMIGDDKFEEMFKTEYSARLKALKPFLAEKSTDERLETAKKEILAAMKVTPTPPRFTVEKGQRHSVVMQESSPTDDKAQFFCEEGHYALEIDLNLSEREAQTTGRGSGRVEFQFPLERANQLLNSFDNL